MHLIYNYLISLLVVFLTIIAQIVVSDQFPTCRPEDFKYDFTECDEFGGRWRVSVPENPKKCTGGAPNAPIRVDKCYTSCDSGQFFNSTSLLCQKCEPGFYSLGGGIRIELFNATALPSGFHIMTQNTRSSSPCIGWHINSNYIESMSNYSDGGCVSVISYTVKIVKRGKLRFTYQYSIPEDLASATLFTFHYRNYDESGDEDSTGFNFDNYVIKFPSATSEQQKWKSMEIKLPNPGLYVFVWKSVIIGHSKGLGTTPLPLRTRSPATFDGPPGTHSDVGVIRIKSLYVDGVAYASECSPCEPGTYSDTVGSELCTPCPSNTAYPKTGAVKCNPCNPTTEYAPRGSDHCFEKPVCGHNDYYRIASECDLAKGRQLISYKWIEPKICRDTNNVFPKSRFQPCNETSRNSDSNQVCNLGMELRDDGKCHFCKVNQYRDETMEKCKQCPPSTSPFYALSYKVWRTGKSGNTSLPEYFSTQCARSDGENEYDCDDSVAWQSNAGTEQYIRTGPSTLLGSYLVLSLTVPGFRIQTGGEITFNFEIECDSEDKCNFIFMESKGSGRLSQQTSFINQWNGQTIGIQTYRYRIEQNVSVSFSWVFRRQKSFQSYVKIYEITLTNPMVGSAIKCNPCPQGSGRNCVPCPYGQYLNVDKGSDDLEGSRSRNRASSNTPEQCLQCPKNTIINSSLAFPVGRQNSCIPCGPSLADYKGISCYSDCHVNIDGDSFDLSQLKQPLIYKGGHLFTAGGTQYFHLFNITLCGKPEFGAVCLNNISSFGSSDAAEEEYGIHSMICRSTIIPDREQIYGTQSVSLGDELIGITRSTTYKNITVHPEFQTTNSDLHFYYSTRVPTAACLSGRRLTLTVRCAPDLEESMAISTPKACPDGTCDGCNFHLLVRTKTAAACRLCRPSDYQTVIGECVDGFQQVHFVNPKGCILSADGQIPVKTRPCSVIPRQVQIGIALVAALGVILLVLVFHFWKKNRNLEYKYCKLIEGNEKSAECCAEDDDEYDNEDQVIVHGKKHKEAHDGGYETIQLTKHNEEMI